MNKLPLELIDEIAIFCLEIDLLEPIDYLVHNNGMYNLYKALKFQSSFYYRKRLQVLLDNYCTSPNPRFIEIVYRAFYHDFYVLEITKCPVSKVTILCDNLTRIGSSSNRPTNRRVIQIYDLWKLVSSMFPHAPSIKQIKTCELLKQKIWDSRFMIEADWLDLLERCHPACLSYSKAINLLSLF